MTDGLDQPTGAPPRTRSRGDRARADVSTHLRPTTLRDAARVDAAGAADVPAGMRSR